MKRIAIYPGTFDPVTNGHIDIVRRAVELFDELWVTVAINPTKEPMFTTEQRVRLLEESLRSYPTVKIDKFSGLIVDHAREVGAKAIIRGLRAVSDFEYEFQMALMNRKLADEITTVFLMPNEKYTYLNSSLIRGLARFGADVNEFVPACVMDALKKSVN